MSHASATAHSFKLTSLSLQHHDTLKHPLMTMTFAWERVSFECFNPVVQSSQLMNMIPDVQSGQNQDPSSETIVVCLHFMNMQFGKDCDGKATTSVCQLWKKARLWVVQKRKYEMSRKCFLQKKRKCPSPHLLCHKARWSRGLPTMIQFKPSRHGGNCGLVSK